MRPRYRKRAVSSVTTNTASQWKVTTVVRSKPAGERERADVARCEGDETPDDVADGDARAGVSDRPYYE